MRHYCTLSDKKYLPKLVAMLDSLKRHSSEPFQAHVLCLDSETFYLLYEMNLGEHVVTMPLSVFERALNLEPIRKSRTWQEYCWTCASSLMEYMMSWVGDVTYLDADLFFFSDPKVIFEEIGGKSIGITPHRFPPERRHQEANGIYNVGLVHANNTQTGRKCIAEWAKNCREWCFNRIEEHHACGDQKYLDYWERDYPGEICAIQNIGVNLAPWNISQYEIRQCFVESPDGQTLTLTPYVNNQPVVFYHLHEFEGPKRLTYYHLRPQDGFIYAPYIEAWEYANYRIRQAEETVALSKALLEMEAQRA